MDEERLKAILEGLLFAAGEPVSLNRLAAVLDSVPKEQIRDALTALGSQYAQGGRGLTVEEVAGGYQLRTRKEFAPQIRKLLAGKPPRLSRSLLETRGHELTLHLPQEPVFVQADAVRLAQVLSNLLNNAAKYTEPGGRVWLTVERQNSEVVFRVRDNGMGIPEAEQGRIWDRLYRGDKSRSQRGLGLGLSVVRAVVQAHNGTVTVTSKPGEGSEFSIVLPTAAPQFG